MGQPKTAPKEKLIDKFVYVMYRRGYNSPLAGAIQLAFCIGDGKPP